MVLFFTHIPFVVNHTINATPPERLQLYVTNQIALRLFFKGSGRNLVRYITHDMIKRLAKTEQLEDIRTLNFTLAGDKKIKVGRTKC